MDAWINPTTRDYELTAGVRTADPANGLANAVYLRLQTPLGSYWRYPLMGSLLHTLAREKDLVRISQLAVQYCEESLQPLKDDGRATAIAVSAEQLHDGRLRLLVEVTDAADIKRVFEHQVKVK
jgi:phage gp46-like protein